MPDTLKLRRVAIDLPRKRRLPASRLRRVPQRRLSGAPIAANRHSKIEMTAFVVACAQVGLERDEVLSLTRAMAEGGQRLDWGEPLVADKHGIGGIPGNRTSMIVMPNGYRIDGVTGNGVPNGDDVGWTHHGSRDAR